MIFFQNYIVALYFSLFWWRPICRRKKFAGRNINAVRIIKYNNFTIGYLRYQDIFTKQHWFKPLIHVIFFVTNVKNFSCCEGSLISKKLNALSNKHSLFWRNCNGDAQCNVATCWYWVQTENYESIFFICHCMQKLWYFIFAWILSASVYKCVQKSRRLSI